MIFPTNRPKPTTQETWTSRLKMILFTNHSLCKKIPKNKVEMSQKDAHGLWRSLSNNYLLAEEKESSTGNYQHGPYSDYITVTNNRSLSNQIVEYFPYFKHLEENDKELYQAELLRIAKRVNSKEGEQEWVKICQQYSPCLDLAHLIQGTLDFLSYGTSVVFEWAKIYKCKVEVLMFTFLELRKTFITKKVNTAFTLSLEQGDPLTLEAVSQATKMLFCPLCLIYDCSKHPTSELSRKHKYQFVPAYSQTTRIINRKRMLAEIMSHLAVISIQHKESGLKMESQESCSPHCYKIMTKSSWQQIQRQKNKKPFSPIFRLLFKMGIQMHDFNPCALSFLFPSKTIKCSDIFFYLIHCYSINQQLNFKFCKNEAEYLKKERAHQTPTTVISRKYGKSLKMKRIRKANDAVNANTVCFHYFMGGIQEDVDCVNCHCQERGYCLPECQCSDKCPIQLKGCRCKGKCKQNCNCLKVGRACIPSVCTQCFDCKREEQVSCPNSEIAYKKSKSTRVGPSTIYGAGLGLFASEPILKHSFIIKYIGEVIESQSLETLRQNLCKQSIFYNFKLHDGKSIDSRFLGNKASFINHSKLNPNVVPQKLTINEEETMIFRALKDIRQGQELLFNYNGSGELDGFTQKYPFLE